MAYRHENKLPIDESDPDVEWRLEWLDDFHPEAAEALLAPEAFAAANRALHPKPCPRPPAPPTKP